MDTPAKPTVLKFYYSGEIGCVFGCRKYQVGTKAILKEYSTKQQFREDEIGNLSFILVNEQREAINDASSDELPVPYE